jgi:hypothetical protein
MPRCAPLPAVPAGPARRRLLPLLPLLALGGAAAPVWAQLPRNFPATALRGEIVVAQPPQILLNGRPAQLAPGARIRGADNMLQLSGALVNQRLVVHYTLDIVGNVHDVWVLTPAELARRPWPVTPQQAQTWLFNPDLQRWTPR